MPGGRAEFPLSSSVAHFQGRSGGWGTWIRTTTNGVRVRCSTVKLSPTGPLCLVCTLTSFEACAGSRRLSGWRGARDRGFFSRGQPAENRPFTGSPLCLRSACLPALGSSRARRPRCPARATAAAGSAAACGRRARHSRRTSANGVPGLGARRRALRARCRPAVHDSRMSRAFGGVPSAAGVHPRAAARRTGVVVRWNPARRLTRDGDRRGRTGRGRTRKRGRCRTTSGDIKFEALSSNRAYTIHNQRYSRALQLLEIHEYGAPATIGAVSGGSLQPK